MAKKKKRASQKPILPDNADKQAAASGYPRNDSTAALLERVSTTARPDGKPGKRTPANNDSHKIMDAKMDSGYVPPGDSFEADFDVCKDLKPTEVLWIMDELLRLEMSFHDGYPLSQNIFTSLHIFRLIHPANKAPYHFRFEGNPSESTLISQHLIHTVLRAYCIAVIKCVECVLQTIQRQTYFEEEDFVTHLFGRELLPACSTQEARKLLVEAMDFVDGIPPRAPNEEEWRHIAFALKHRLVVREHILFSMSGRDSQWRPLRDKILSMDREHQEATPVPEAFSDKVTRQLATR